jgi:hypothetical protein
MYIFGAVAFTGNNVTWEQNETGVTTGAAGKNKQKRTIEQHFYIICSLLVCF